MNSAGLIMAKLLTALKVKNYVNSVYGIKMIPNWGDNTFRYCIAGSYGDILSNFLSEYRDEAVFVDIGANQGLYSILAAQNSNIVKCHAFEPVQPVCEILRKNLLLNDAASKVDVHMVAVSDRNKDSTIEFSASHTGASSLVTPTTNSGHVETVPIREATGSYLSFLRSCPNLIVKIDVEGAEAVVYEQIQSHLEMESVSALFVEFNVHRADPTPMLRRVLENGFKIADITDSLGGQFDLLFTKEAPRSELSI